MLIQIIQQTQPKQWAPFQQKREKGQTYRCSVSKTNQYTEKCSGLQSLQSFNPDISSHILFSLGNRHFAGYSKTQYLRCSGHMKRMDGHPTFVGSEDVNVMRH